ncbi:MAG: hypothetical protein EOL89_00145 [Actinobacteria bacterium]|nr:hypothetical protein [Actinomycetota bacterium]
MDVRYAAVTNVGSVRSENQDAILIDGLASTQDVLYRDKGGTRDGDAPLVFAVFDGMGGHAGGGTASRIAAMVVGAAPSPRTEAEVVERLRRANALILEETRLRPDLTGMGTTAVVVSVSADGFVVASVGDSAVFRVLGTSLGELTAPDRVPDPRRPGAWLLTAALGPSASVTPHTDVYPVAAPTRLVLASDGLTDVVDRGELRRIATGTDDPEAAALALTAAVLRGGGPDNVSVIVLDLESGLD